MNFVALLAVLAAASFALPLLVQGAEAAGLGRSVSVAGSLALAVVLACLFLARTVLADVFRRPRRSPLRRGSRPASGRRPARAQGTGAGPSPAAGLAEPHAQSLPAGLRLVDAEEESRAGL